jgi:hypothetical protein
MANLYRLSQYFLTTLSVAGGIDASQTTDIVLQAVTGIDEPTKPGIALLNYSDPLETSACEWITYTSVNTTTKELQGVARGQEDYSAKAHANGVTVAFPLSKSHINNIVDKLEGLDTGVTLDQPTLTSPTINTPSITTPKVVTAHAIGTAGATETVNWANGDLQTMTLDENITITFSNAVAGQRLTLFMLQDGTGTNTITWADTITWQDGITWSDTYYSKTADKMNVVVIYYDGTNYYGMGAKFA